MYIFCINDRCNIIKNKKELLHTLFVVKYVNGKYHVFVINMYLR